MSMRRLCMELADIMLLSKVMYLLKLKALMGQSFLLQRMLVS
jgi:hypothetical protein